MRTVGRVALAAIMLMIGLGGIVAFFSARDDATVEAGAPGLPAPGERGPLLAAGNVRITFSDPADADALRALAADFGGSRPALVEAGQAVLVERGGQGIVAHAFGRRLEVSSPRDPELRRFVEHWLGRGRE